jgi:hypothetical protein
MVQVVEIYLTTSGRGDLGLVLRRALESKANKAFDTCDIVYSCQGKR